MKVKNQVHNMHKLRDVGAQVAPVWWRSRGLGPRKLQYRVLQHIQYKILPKFVHFNTFSCKQFSLELAHFPR